MVLSFLTVACGIAVFTAAPALPPRNESAAPPPESVEAGAEDERVPRAVPAAAERDPPVELDPPRKELEPPPERKVPAEAELPPALRVGNEGIFRPGLLLQAWFRYDWQGDDSRNTFRLRRAEIHVRGEIVPSLVMYDVMIDPAKVLEPDRETIDVIGTDGQVIGEVEVLQPVSPISAMQDLFITYTLPYVDISIGQFKIPVSYEGYNSSSRLLFPERAVIARVYGDKREMGLRLAKGFEHFGYYAGIFNGTGPNRLDFDNAKDVGVRVEAYPLEGILLGAVAYGSIGAPGRPPDGKERYEGDLVIDHGPFLLVSEYIWARDAVSGRPTVHSTGFYVQAAWLFADALQVAARVGYFDPELGSDAAPEPSDSPTASVDDELWHFEGGVNYYILGQQAKIQLAYSRFQYDDLTPVDEVIFAAQVAY